MCALKQRRRWSSIWSVCREAIGGTDRDFTQEPLKRAMFLLAVPMVLEMMMESIFAVVDMFFVSRLGAEAVATVGITEALMTIVYAIGGGLATATTAIVSRRIGEGDHVKASSAGMQAIYSGLLVSLAIAVPGMMYAGDILEAMGGTSVMVNEMSGYASLLLGGNVVIMLLFIINAIFRSSGDAAISMRVLFLANLINIVLDPLFIFGIGPIEGMGVKGAAVATTTGRGIAVLYQLYILFKGKRRICPGMKQLAPDLNQMALLMKLALGGIGQSIITTSSWILLMRIIAGFGSSVVAGYTIAIRVIVFSLLPSVGLSNAASTLVGQNLGAGKPERAQKAVYITAMVNMIMMGLISILFITTPMTFIRLFAGDGALALQAQNSLRVISYGFVFYGLGMVMTQTLNGAGDTFTPTLINLFCFWALEIPLAWYLSKHTGLQESGVYYAITIAESIMALIGLAVFRKGRWKLQKV